MPEDLRLIYVHDPMCSWCWGFRPVLQRLLARLPRQIGVRRLLGGLAPDSDQAMAEVMRRHLQDTWRSIQQRIPGTRFNFDFWLHCEPRRSTWPACRAVIAARQLDPGLELGMIEAIQRAYYLEARNPSDADTLVALARQLGLDGTAFAHRLDAADTKAQLAAEIAEARALGVDSFPSLRLQAGGHCWPVAVDYTDVDAMLEIIDHLMASDR